MQKSKIVGILFEEKSHSDLEEFQVPCLRNVGGGHGIYVGLCRPVQAPIYKSVIELSVTLYIVIKNMSPWYKLLIIYTFI